MEGSLLFRWYFFSYHTDEKWERQEDAEIKNGAANAAP